MKQPIICLDLRGEDIGLAGILADLPPEAENILICGTEPPDQSRLADWVFSPQVMAKWENGGTYLGRDDQPPIVALRQGERKVHMRWTDAWFDEPVQADQANDLLARADLLVQSTFRLKDANFASPVSLGQHLMAAAWNKDGIKVPPAPPEIRALLSTIGPQGRHEILTLPHLETIPGLYGYDMRLAYLWCCKGLPYGKVTCVPSDCKTHKLLANWSAPEGWSHIGLLPQKRTDWAYPLIGHDGWIDVREQQLALRNGWSVRSTEGGLIWECEGALDRWSDGLQKCLRKCGDNKPLYRLFRRVALNTIGSLHRTHIRRSRAIPANGRQAPPAGNTTLKLSADGRTYFWQEDEPVRGRQLLYCHPEWTSTIWARCRARVAQAALQVPREQVIAIRQDALFLSELLPTHSGGDVCLIRHPRIGDFRLKESVPRELPAPHTLEDLQALRGLANA